MRAHSAVYVDAGYLVAAAATRVTGTSLRGSVTIDFAALVAGLIGQAEQVSGLPALRVNWYDAARDGHPDPVQQAIGMLPHVKVRLGRTGLQGEQKGVDLRIGLDMVAHARNGAVDTIVLVSGDDDLTEAVEEVQMRGAQVVIFAVPSKTGAPYGLSRNLQRASDDVVLVDAEMLDAVVTPLGGPTPPRPEDEAADLSADSARAPAAQPPSAIPSPADVAARMGAGLGQSRRDQNPPAVAAVAYSTSSGDERDGAIAVSEADQELIRQVVERVVASWRSGAGAVERLVAGRVRPSIPRELDRALLLDLSGAMGVSDLPEPLRIELRAQFWDEFDRVMG
ncbi:MAG: NYN domain-containing protein [Micrococcales bacterium]|nr:NYN domain-containing protein [Micrococcales bacterium]